MEEDTQTVLPEQAVLDEGPERFDPALLAQPPAARVAWFEKECTINIFLCCKRVTPSYEPFARQERGRV